MRVAIIGPGGVGGSLGTLLARAGHEVVFAGGADPGALAQVVDRAGPNARTDRVADAIDDAGVAIMAVPFDRFADVARQAGPSLRGKVVVDTSNPVTLRKGLCEFQAIPGGVTAARHQQRILGPVHLVKAFNLVCASQLAEVAQRTGYQRVAVPFVGDDPGAKLAVAALIADASFVPVDAGDLADAAVIEPTSVDDWLPILTEPEARLLLRHRTTRPPAGNAGPRAAPEVGCRPGPSAGRPPAGP